MASPQARQSAFFGLVRGDGADGDRRASLLRVRLWPDPDRRTAMSDFYGIKPGTVPGFAEVGTGKFMGVGSLPEETVRHMLEFMERLREMCRDDELAFEICVRHIASVIEDQRRTEGRADPREEPTSLCGGSGPVMGLDTSGCSRSSRSRVAPADSDSGRRAFWP